MDVAVPLRASTSKVRPALRDVFRHCICTRSKKDVAVLNGILRLSMKTVLGVVGADLVDTTFVLLRLNITVQLVTVNLDPSTKEPKLSAKSVLKIVPLTDSGGSSVSGDGQYTVTFDKVPKNFGEVGAFKIWNLNLNKFSFH